MFGKEVLKELSPYQQGKQIEEIKAQYQLDQVVKLSSNENPYGFSEHVKEVLQNQLDLLHIYPDGYASKLRTALANQLGVEEQQLVFGSGSDELIQIICRTFLYDGTNTVMATPTFTQYKHHSLIEGAEIVEVPTKDGYHQLDEMIMAINDMTKVVWICAPDNPSGTMIHKNDLLDFLKQCPSHVIVVLDEAYYEYIDPDHRIDGIDLLKTYPNLVLLRTFSKAYGIAALRIGYAITSEQVADKLNVVRGPFNTTTLTQEAALSALFDQSFIHETVTKNKRVKQLFQRSLADIGWEYYPSQTNFVLVKTPISGLEVFDYLIRYGYIVRPGELLGYPNTIRVTIGTEEDMLSLSKVILQLDNETKK